MGRMVLAIIHLVIFCVHFVLKGSRTHPRVATSKRPRDTRIRLRSAGRTRTYNQWINSPLLYQLSSRKVADWQGQGTSRLLSTGAA